MSYWEALGYATAGVGAFGLLLGIALWTPYAWSVKTPNGWIDRILNFIAWVILIGTVIYFANQPRGLVS